MSRVLITGGAGFIGSHLCERFLDDGHEVICVDNLITGSADNIAHLFPNARFSFVPQYVTNYIYVKGPLDAILHFASPASPIDYLELPIQTLKVGSLGTHKALGLAKEKTHVSVGVHVRGLRRSLMHPQKEDYWGNVNSIGLRAFTMKETICRGYDNGLSSGARHTNAHRADFQYLWSRRAARRSGRS
jgi:dTDP-glucose 4,6-dehydratase